ncbi:MAG: hypothetical protein V4550_18720 [Gemmatimonadota bacterium]
MTTSSLQQIVVQPDGHVVVNGGVARRDGRQMCLDYYPARGNNGDPIKLYPCRPLGGAGDSHRWSYSARGEFVSGSGRCIDISGGKSRASTEGQPLSLWDCPDRENYGTRRWLPQAQAQQVFTGNVQLANRVYLVDGTSSEAKHQNATFQLYEAAQPNSYYHPGVTDFAFAKDAKNILNDVVNQVCDDMRQKRIRNAAIVGFSRGAIIAMAAAKRVMAECGAPVVFLGLIDAVNTSMPDDAGWSSTVPNNIPALFLAKRSEWEDVFTTATITGARLTKQSSPYDGRHWDMTCDNGGKKSSQWVKSTMTGALRAAGFTIDESKFRGTKC